MFCRHFYFICEYRHNIAQAQFLLPTPYLIKGKWYYTYCDKLLTNEPGKTCRDVGSKRSYDKKCKTDPVWQTYNRAYKAHYARYMQYHFAAFSPQGLISKRLHSTLYLSKILGISIVKILWIMTITLTVSLTRTR